LLFHAKVPFMLIYLLVYLENKICSLRLKDMNP
jgi:hypothetical protein